MADNPPSAPPVSHPAVPTPQRTTRFARSPTFVDIYSNNARLSSTPYDIGMIFSRLINPAPEITTIEDLAIVRMSPHEFKFFVDAVAKTLKAWEEIFGQIPESKKVSFDRIKESFRKLKETIDNQP